MPEFASTDEVLDFAIEKEQEAQRFYQELAQKAPGPAMAEFFRRMARQEAGHRQKLIGVKQGRRELVKGGEVADLKLSDYLVEVQARPDMDYQDALVVAMQREKASFALYTDLAALAADEDTRELFQSLAQEEASHKLHLEREYDQYVLGDN